MINSMSPLIKSVYQSFNEEYGLQRRGHDLSKINNRVKESIQKVLIENNIKSVEIANISCIPMGTLIITFFYNDNCITIVEQCFS